MNKQTGIDILTLTLLYDQYDFDDFNGQSIFTITMAMQPYFIGLLETLTRKEREHCKELAQKSLPKAVKKYVVTLLDSKPGEVSRREEEFLKGYSESGRRWLRRTAQEFLESALYRLYGSAYELRIFLNQVHLAIARAHPSSPFLKPLKRRMKELVQPINLFFTPLPWLVELSYLSLSYPGNTIIDASSVIPFEDALKLIALDSKRLETVRFAVEHDPYIGEENPYSPQIIQKLHDIQNEIRQFGKVPFHRGIILLYGTMALIYEELGNINHSRTIADKFIEALTPLIESLNTPHERTHITHSPKEWFDIAIFMTVVALQIVNRTTGWQNEVIERLKDNLLSLIELIKENKEILSTGETPLMARASNWLAIHGYYDEAYQLLESAGWFSLDPETAFRPIERIDFSVAHYWCLVKEKNWSEALRTVSKLEQIVPQRPIYYYLTELLRFVVALMREDYELLSATADRVYHWNRRHPNFFPTLGKTLRYIALNAPRFVYPSDWDKVVERISEMYQKFPFYLTNVEKHTRLLRTIAQKGGKQTSPVPTPSINTEKSINVKPLEDVISTLTNYLKGKSVNNDENNSSFN
ncbi:MAG: hypothetical protein GXO48_02115 [Chlorobi bacterium]|nr:hypothetical protein [Chlorobiota bacterium]